MKASLFEPRALAAAMPSPERSVNRPMRSGASPSRMSREMGSKRRERRESRCGTRRIRWAGTELPGFVEAEGPEMAGAAVRATATAMGI